MHQRVKNVLDRHEILIPLSRLVQRIFQYALATVSKFVFIRTQINHFLNLYFPKENLVHYFVTAGLPFSKRELQKPPFPGG